MGSTTAYLGGSATAYLGGSATAYLFGCVEEIEIKAGAGIGAGIGAEHGNVCDIMVNFSKVSKLGYIETT